MLNFAKRGGKMVKLKKLTISLILGTLFLLPTSASAANVYGVVSNKWEGSGTIEAAVSLGGDTIFVGNSSDLAVLSMESGGSVVSHEKKQTLFSYQRDGKNI